MAKTLLTDFRAAIISMVFFTLLCGLAYPLAITGVAQAALPRQANGSIVHKGGNAVGSSSSARISAAPNTFTPAPPPPVRTVTMPLPPPAPTLAPPAGPW